METCKLSNLSLVLPKSCVLCKSGIILLSTSALNTLSTGALSPKITFPSKLISPVVCNVPSTLVLVKNSIAPVPFASSVEMHGNICIYLCTCNSCL